MWLTCSWWFTHITLSVKQESDVFMDGKEKERIWKEMVDSNKRRIGVVSEELEVVRKERGGWREELISDLWLLVILLVVWISFLSIIEIIRYYTYVEIVWIP